MNEISIEELEKKLEDEGVKKIKDVVKSLNKDMKEMYKYNGYENLKDRDYFKVNSYWDVGNKLWGISIGNEGLYSEDHAIECGDFDRNEEPVKALKHHIILCYNAYLRELQL